MDARVAAAEAAAPLEEQKKVMTECTGPFDPPTHCQAAMLPSQRELGKGNPYWRIHG